MPGDMTRYWTDLQSDNVPRAYRAIDRFTNLGEEAITFLSEKLHPSPDEEKQIKRLINKLDSPFSGDIKESMKKLREMAPSPAFWKQAKGSLSTSAYTRIKEIMATQTTVLPESADMRRVRALVILERMGTPRARKVLESLGKLAPSARQTRDARTILERLDRRKKDK